MLHAIKQPTNVISVIIPCYNQGRFLADAIESVLHQHYKPLEIVVVDDGSTDNTKSVALKYEQVKYIYQSNKGLSAARNFGIAHSTGNFLVFLDADDWLLKDALATNVACILKHSDAAFVSGKHIEVNIKNEVTSTARSKAVTQNHYCHFLIYNYIEMFATAMFRRRVFDDFQFDCSLKACEDYDLFLNIARTNAIYHHDNYIAAYRRHGESMTMNSTVMIEEGFKVRQRQLPCLTTEEEKAAFKKGIEFWKNYNSRIIYNRLKANAGTNVNNKREDLDNLFKYHKQLYLKYQLYMVLKKMPAPIKKLVLLNN